MWYSPAVYNDIRECLILTFLEGVLTREIFFKLESLLLSLTLWLFLKKTCKLQVDFKVIQQPPSQVNFFHGWLHPDWWADCDCLVLSQYRQLACVRISPRVRPLPYMYFNAGWNIATCVASQTRKELMILTWCCSHMSIYCCTISVYKCISRILERFIFEAILFKKSSGHRRHLPWLRRVSAFHASSSPS